MANYRQVHTKIWKDTWFLSLPPDDKLLFVYLFSNEQASIAGIYELPVMVIAFETGLSIEYVTDALARFEAAGKVRYQDGIVWVVNLRKYNENPSPKVRTRIENDIALIPDLEIKRDYIQYHNGIDTLSIPELKTESEHEHEQEQEQEIEQESSPPSADAAAKPPEPKPPSETILPDTPEARVMFAKLAANAKAHDPPRRGPKRFASLQQKRKFIQAAARLDGHFQAALDDGLEGGITSVKGLVNYIAKWQPDRYQRPQQRGSPQKKELPLDVQAQQEEIRRRFRKGDG